MKVILINLLLIFGIITCTELTYNFFFKEKETCKNKITHHNYCPNIIIKKKINEPNYDKKIIEIVINNQGYRVQNKEDKIITKEYDSIYLGDSFIQADELNYNETFISYLNNESLKKNFQIGYSSWSPIIYLNILKNIKLKKNVEINIFTMLNDFSFVSQLGNVNYHKKLKTNNHNQLRFFLDENSSGETFFLKIKEFIKQNSFFYKYLYSKLINFPENKFNSKKKNYVFYKSFVELNTNCKELYNSKNQVSELLYEYISFSFHRTCWEKNLLYAVENTIVDLNSIIEYIETVHEGTVNVFFVPAGWNFSQENLIGKTMPPYNLSQDSIIGSDGLSQFLKEHLKNDKGKFINLVEVFNHLKKEEKNEFYFPIDGHWNALTHKLLSIYLLEDL